MVVGGSGKKHAAARDAALAYYETRMHGAAKEHGGVFDAIYKN